MNSATAELDASAPTAVEEALGAYELAFDHLLKLVEDGGLDAHDDLGLLAVAQCFERLRRRQSLVDHRMVRDLETRGVPGRLCQPNVARVLAQAMLLSPAEASRRVRAAAQLGDRVSMAGLPLPPLRPALAAAQRAGEASPEQVDICLRALEKVDHRGLAPADLEAADELLGDFCAGYAPPELRDLAGRVVDRIDPDGSRPDDELQQARRTFSLRKARDGSYACDGRLSGALGAKLATVLSPLAAPRTTTTTVQEGRTTVQHDDRQPGQRMHDALEEACDRLLQSDTLPDSGGTPTTVIVTITLDDLERRTGTGVTSDGVHLTTEQLVRDLAGQALVHPVVVDAKGGVLWMGRTSRLATRAQTMALVARDGGCSFPGCSHPPEWCERHHVVAWIDGGPTDLDNLTLLCRYHHHHFLARGWACRIVDGLPRWTPPAWIDPLRRPQLNARIAARHLRC